MKQSDLNSLLYTDSKEITHNTLTSIHSLETLETLQQTQDKDDIAISRDSIKPIESLSNKHNFKQDSVTTHLHKQTHSLAAHVLVNSAKNPYKDSMQKTNTYNISAKHKKTIYVSVGDINGIGLELILRNHSIISQWCMPIYCVDEVVLFESARLLHIEIPDDMYIVPLNIDDVSITPGVVCAKSGFYSFMSFCRAVDLSIENNASIVTLPINKYAWQLAGIRYAGHTEYLRDRFKKDVIMMLGCESMFVALYTDHIPLRKVADKLQKDSLLQFFRNFYHAYNALFISANDSKSTNNDKVLKDSISKQLDIPREITSEAVRQNAINAKMAKRLLYDTHNANQTYRQETNNLMDSGQHSNTANEKVKKPLQIAVLGLNPHAGDNGVLGHEDILINECISHINKEIGSEVFIGTFAPDSAFIPNNRKLYQVFIAMYHDVGLAPLKALYFDRSINVSLNLPILRTSPDHGTCFDKAYKLHHDIGVESYLESFRFILKN